MTAEYYSDQTKRYATFMKNYGKNELFKIACGPSDDDYNWTDVMMKRTASNIDGLSLHHYSFDNGKIATDFNEGGWFGIMKSSLQLDDLISRHSAIMDKYDPGKRVALEVDEWGTWYKVEPGTNPAFLYQQNTMRDAVAAASSLNIFNNHCDRVRMANIAQMVNVLQAMILTDGSKMVVTPTYYVFDLFKVHQDAMRVQTQVKAADYSFNGENLPAVNCSASIDDKGKMHVSLCNINPDAPEKVKIGFSMFKPDGISGKILTAGKMNADNTFDEPDRVVPHDFADFKLTGDSASVELPPMSVVVLEVTGTLETSPAIELKNPKPGLDYRYYEGRWDMLPNFDLLTPKDSGTVESIAIPKKNSGENFGVEYDGYIKLPKDGLYTFYTNSDDGSSLYIDDQLLVSNDGRHASTERSGTIVLKAGFHKFKALFFQAGGGMTMEASVEGPGLAKKIISPDMLFRE